MNETDTSGNQKGSLKDRLFVLNVLMRISRKKKFRIKFSNINANKILNSKMYLRFYNPVRLIVDEKLNVKNAVLYKKSHEENVKLIDTKKISNVDINVIKRKRKKGANIKEEISEKYNINIEEISDNLARDYEIIKNDILHLKIDEEIKEEFLSDRVFVKEEMDLIYKYKDVFLVKDIEYNLKDNFKNEEKLKKMLDKFDKDILFLEKNIDKFNVVTFNEFKLTNLNVLFKNLFGIGVGVLTLPLSYPVSLALGTSLIAKSMDNIVKNVKFEKKDRKLVKYNININDIASLTNSLNSSNYLLDETIEKLEILKYKIKENSSKIPDFEINLKKIEILEESLINKKRKLNKYLNKIEKNKTKVLKRDDLK